MSLPGLRIKLRVGEDNRPAQEAVMEAFSSASVTPAERGPIGFQLTFNIGRVGAADLPDYKLLSMPELQPFSRVVLSVIFSVEEEVLVDGYITDQQLNPGNEPGTSTLTLTGEDVSVMMNLEQRARAYPDRKSYDEIVDLGSRVGHVFYVTPGPRVGSNGVFWGVPERDPNPQKPLSVNMGPSTNVESVDFRYETLAPNEVAYRDEDGKAH